jgi:HD-GYP domain-containing protein (c-di-GMP phosphodiesterase class II)
MPENLISAIDRVCTEKAPWDTLAQKLCSLLRRNLKHYHWVGIYKVEDKELVLKAWDGPQATEHTRIPISQGICGAAVREKETLIVDNVSKDPRYLACFRNTRSEIVVPIFSGSQILGEIDIDSDAEAAFGETDRTFLEWVAGKLGSAFTQTEQSPGHPSPGEELETFYLEMIQLLAQASNIQDSYTQEHAERSQKFARELAQEMGLSEPTVRTVELAMMLHGIGKIGIDRAILSKPGKLTPQEFEQIKKHTMIGHRLLAKVRSLGPVAQIVLYHQEWYNGKGYPEGLKGEEIPLGARIVAVINAWEAMNSDRPYRKRLSRERALEELQKGVGTQFDPRVVDSFLRLESRQH